MKRQLDNWLVSYLEYTKDTESPMDFHLWTGLSVLGAVTRRHIFIDRGLYKLYPNLFVVLIARSAICRKTTALNIGNTLLYALNEPIYSAVESATGPAIIDIMQARDGCLHLAIGEFSTFITDVFKTGLAPLITRLYDCPDEYGVSTVKRGNKLLQNVFFSLIGATTPTDLTDLAPYKKAATGLIGRMIFVHREDSNIIANPPALKPELTEKLLNDLNHISHLSGQIKLTQEVRTYYDTWYQQHCIKVKECVSDVAQGYMGRKHDTIFKIGALLVISEGDTRVMNIKHFKKAQELVEVNEADQLKVCQMIGSSEAGTDQDFMSAIISKHKKIDHTALLQRVGYKWHADDVKRIIDSLSEAGKVTVHLEEVKPGKKRKKIYKWRGGEENA